MIKFPVLNWLRIDDYALYPGKSTEPGLFADFTTNLNLVVGANGLGKSTLLTVAFRMLTGPFDIPGAARSGDAGETAGECGRDDALCDPDRGHDASGGVTIRPRASHRTRN